MTWLSRSRLSKVRRQNEAAIGRGGKGLDGTANIGIAVRDRREYKLDTKRGGNRLYCPQIICKGIQGPHDFPLSLLALADEVIE